MTNQPSTIRSSQEALPHAQGVTFDEWPHELYGRIEAALASPLDLPTRPSGAVPDVTSHVRSEKPEVRQ